MTRKELAVALLNDESRSNEEVYFRDYENNKYIRVESVKSIQADILRDGYAMDAQFPSRFCSDKFLNREQVTVID